MSDETHNQSDERNAALHDDLHKKASSKAGRNGTGAVGMLSLTSPKVNCRACPELAGVEYAHAARRGDRVVRAFVVDERDDAPVGERGASAAGHRESEKSNSSLHDRALRCLENGEKWLAAGETAAAIEAFMTLIETQGETGVPAAEVGKSYVRLARALVAGGLLDHAVKAFATGLSLARTEGVRPGMTGGRQSVTALRSAIARMKRESASSFRIDTASEVLRELEKEKRGLWAAIRRLWS